MKQLINIFNNYIIVKQSDIYKALKQNVPNRNLIKSFMLILTMLSIFCEAYLIICMQKLIDAAINFATVQDYSEFKYVLFLTLGVFILSLIIFLFIARIIDFYMEKDFVLNSSKFFLKSFFKQAFSFIKRKENDSGTISYKLQNDVVEVAKWLMIGAWTIWSDIFAILIQYSILFVYSPQIAIFCIIVIFISFITTRKIITNLAAANKRIYDAYSTLNQFYIQASYSFIDVKQLGKENLFLKKLIDLLENDLYYYKKISLIFTTIYNFIFDFTAKVFPMIVLVISFYNVIKGKNTVGEAIAIYQLVQLVQEPLLQLSNDISDWKSTMVLSERLDCFMPPEEKDETNCPILSQIDKLCFYCEKFSYPNGAEILRDVNFELNPKDVLCIKGPTGIGKTTLTSLIMKFNPLEGKSYIKINDIDIKDYQNISYYKNVNILNQTPYIFEDTLLNNITIGENFDEEFIKEVIETAQLKDFVDTYGFEHILNENANNISGGQRQRIGLARFLLRKPALLILDEPTSALDSKTSKNLVEALMNFKDKYNMILIVISHSNDFDNVATKILELES